MEWLNRRGTYYTVEAGRESVTVGESIGGLSIHGTNFRGIISTKNILNVKKHKQQNCVRKTPRSPAKKKTRIFLLACKEGKTVTSFTRILMDCTRILFSASRLQANNYI
jgi:hypothetical protein